MKLTTVKKVLFITICACFLATFTSCVTKSGEQIFGPTRSASIKIIKGTAFISGETTLAGYANNTSNGKENSSLQFESLNKNTSIQTSKPIPSFIMNEGDTMSFDVHWSFSMILTVTGIESDVIFTATFNDVTKTYTVSKSNMMGQTLYFNNQH